MTAESAIREYFRRRTIFPHPIKIYTSQEPRERDHRCTKTGLSGLGIFIIKNATAFNSFSHLLILQISAIDTTSAIPQVSSFREMLG